MYFALNKKFTDGSFLNARHLNDIVNKIIEIGGYIGVKFSNRQKLCADKINQIIISINNLILQFPESNIQQLELLSEGDVLCALNLNTIVDKINEIIDYLNNKKEEVYGLTVNQLSSSRHISSSGGNFILSAYITKNRKFYTTDGIQVISDLNYTINDDIITFTISKNEGSEKTFNIKITSEYGEEDILLYQDSKEIIDDSVISLYVSTPQAVVSAGGEVVQYTASIQKNGVNYTTQGLKSNSNYPYGIKETYVDDGVQRIYTVTFDENLSFSQKDYVSTISSYGLEPQNVNIQQEANISSDSIKVYASASKLNYNNYDTSMSFTYYAKVNGQIVLDGVNAEIIQDDVGVVSTNTRTEGNSKITAYTIYKNNDENIKTLTVRASYNGHHSGNIIFTQQGKKSNEEETVDCNCQISNTSESTIVFTSTGGSKEVIFDNSCGKPLVIKNFPDWTECRISGNKLIVSIGDNYGEERTGTIGIGIEECDDIKSTVTIIQEKVYIVSNKGKLLLSFDYINDDNVINDHLYLTGSQDQVFTIYCKKIGPDGLVPGDTSLSKAPILSSFEYGVGYNPYSGVNVQGNNYTYEFTLYDELQDGNVFNISAEFNENYDKSNTIQAEYSEEHATICYVRCTTESGETSTYVLTEPDKDTPGIQGVPLVFNLERDYHSHDGFIQFEFIKKVEGQDVYVNKVDLFSMYGNGAVVESWSSIDCQVGDELPENNGAYTITYHMDENNYPYDRSRDPVPRVEFSDGTKYTFHVALNQFPIIYLYARGDYSMVPQQRGLEENHNVKCDGSYPIERFEYSEKITYYGTKYLDSPVNSYINEYGTNFTEDSEGTVRLVFEEDSTAQLDSVNDNKNGIAYITLKPNNTNQILKLYFYVDYVDKNGNVITSTSMYDRFFERHDIEQDPCG